MRLMMTFSGSPSIYYGSEVGLPGPTGHNRRCMLWNEKDQDLELFAHVKKLIQLRKEHSSFKSVDIKWLDDQPIREHFDHEKRIGR